MVLQYVFVLALAGLVCGAKPGSGSHGDVDGAIEHVEWHYSDALCLDLLVVDCATHVTQGDEQICGSDGNTYANHCKFVHAVCEYYYSAVDLTVASHGACPLTAAPTTPSASMTSPIVAASTMAPVAGSSPIVATTTMAPAGTVTTTMAPQVTTTTTAVPVTTNANHQIIQNVFCQNAATISCSASGVDVICGSDGVLYANQCEFAKAHCKLASLTHADPASCTAAGRR